MGASIVVMKRSIMSLNDIRKHSLTIKYRRKATSKRNVKEKILIFTVSFHLDDNFPVSFVVASRRKLLKASHYDFQDLTLRMEEKCSRSRNILLRIFSGFNDVYDLKLKQEFNYKSTQMISHLINFNRLNYS